MVDESLSILPLSSAFSMAKLIQIDSILEKIVMKELKLTKKKFADLKQQWISDLAKLDENLV